MAMTPEVYDFTRKFGRGQQVQEKPSVIQQIAGTLGNVALAGAGIAGAYGLARALGPETEISPVSAVPTSNVGEPKEKFTYTKDYSGNRSGNYGNPPKKESPSYKGMKRTTQYTKDSYGNDVTPTETVLVEQPTDEIVVVDDPQPAITTPQVDPRSFLSAASNSLIAKKEQEVADFDAGIDWNDTLDRAASAGSPVEGALILGGSVAKKGFHDTKTRIGKDINTAGNIVSEAVANVQKIPAAMQEVDSVIANEQMKASVMPDNKMQETTYLNPPSEGTGGVEIGIESDLSDTPQFDDTHQANEQASLAGLNRQTGLTTSSTTNLNPDLVRETARQLDGLPVSQEIKEAVAAKKLANPAQSVGYLLKSVLAGLTGGEQPTFPGKNPDEGLEDLIGAPAPATSTRMANVGGNFYPVEDSKFVEGLTTYPVSGERAGQVDFHLRNKSTGELNPYGYQVNDALNVALGDMGEEGSLNKESMGQLYNFLKKNPDLMRGV